METPDKSKSKPLAPWEQHQIDMKKIGMDLGKQIDKSFQEPDPATKFIKKD